MYTYVFTFYSVHLIFNLIYTISLPKSGTKKLVHIHIYLLFNLYMLLSIYALPYLYLNLEPNKFVYIHIYLLSILYIWLFMFAIPNLYPNLEPNKLKYIHIHLLFNLYMLLFIYALPDLCPNLEPDKPCHWKDLCWPAIKVIIIYWKIMISSTKIRLKRNSKKINFKVLF